jgi:hypothetical protein
VRRYFIPAPDGCWCKRYRCPRCGNVITLRPEGWWPRFWHAGANIRQTLHSRLETDSWPPGFTRQAGGHWLRGLNNQVKKIFGLATEAFPAGFDELIVRGWVPVSRSKAGVPVPQLC